MSGKLLARLTMTIGLVAASLFLFSSAIFAHHGSSDYDLEHPLSLKGTVTSFEFINPHSDIRFDVKKDQGTIEQWSAEGGSPNSMRRAGWSSKTLKPGDQITVVGGPLKDGGKRMMLIKIIFPDGREMPIASPQ